ncbi:hypothetical protein BDP27DRAFT_1440341 [Rhodocollybia butyracea]|uniref:Uncharacterized protein n=1 Tax=Rhodocollybia butyracea TaxID=206335 RepID=A0A9P5NZV2_9AGAR|nr:hypothetical protein BDP27DRAFT_1440341 [Rhodocollybia butyracea]
MASNLSRNFLVDASGSNIQEARRGLKISSSESLPRALSYYRTKMRQLAEGDLELNEPVEKWKRRCSGKLNIFHLAAKARGYPFKFATKSIGRSLLDAIILPGTNLERTFSGWTVLRKCLLSRGFALWIQRDRKSKLSVPFLLYDTELFSTSTVLSFPYLRANSPTIGHSCDTIVREPSADSLFSGFFWAAHLFFNVTSYRV